MKKLIPFFLILIISYSCSSDDGNESDNMIPEINTIVYDESVDGDLSNSNSTPTTIEFTPGDNIVISNQMSGNADYFTVVIPDGYQLAEINLDSYIAPDRAFIGIAEGTSFSGSSAADLLGGLVYGDTNINTNILPLIGTLDGATGFTDVLSSGEYTVWLNQAGETSEATLNFVVNMP